MANREKRQELRQQALEEEIQLAELMTDWKWRRRRMLEVREEERQENRYCLRMLRRGVPEWLVEFRYFREFMALADQFRHRWLNPINPWPFERSTPDTQINLMIHYLFVKYQVPPSWYGAWQTGDLRLIKWFIHLAQGGNLRTAPGMPIRLTKKMAHLALHAPSDLNLYDAVRYGQVRGMGGSDELARAVIGSSINFRPERQAFWTGLIQWLIHQQVSDADVVKMLVEYLTGIRFYRYRELRQGLSEFGSLAPETFSMKGRSLSKVLKKASQWEMIRTESEDYSHNPMINEVGDFVYRPKKSGMDGWRVEITPILTPLELVEEGAMMEHCVGGTDGESGWFAWAIQHGRASVWSMKKIRHDGLAKRMVTISMGSDFSISMVSGKGNRKPRGLEKQLIHRWARQQGLTIHTYDFGNEDW